MREWIKDAQNLSGIARDNDFFAKKVVAKEFFGSNLLLQNNRNTGPRLCSQVFRVDVVNPFVT
jgi:hypothetical protein